MSSLAGIRSVLTNNAAGSVSFIDGINSTATHSGGSSVAALNGITAASTVMGSSAASQANGGTFYTTTSSSGNVTEQRGVTGYTSAGSLAGAVSSAVGVMGYTTKSNGSGTSNSRGGQFYASNTGTGSITNAYGVDVYASNGSTGSMSNAHGLSSRVSNTGGGTITTGYGVHIGAIQATNKWSLYATDATAPSHFAGSVGIGATTLSDKLHVVGDVRVGTSGTNGCVKNFAGTGIVGTCASDMALKTDIQSLPSLLSRFETLSPVTYKWNETAAEKYKNDTQVANVGLLAQDVEEAFPELVSKNADGYKQVDFAALSVYAYKALIELADKVSEKAHLVVEKLTAKEVVVEKLCVKKESDGGIVCVTGDELAELVAAE